MPNPSRILERLRSGPPPDMSTADVVTLLESLDWDIREGKGSHLVVTSPCGYPITLARDAKKIKRGYLRLLLKEVERCGGE